MNKIMRFLAICGIIVLCFSSFSAYATQNIEVTPLASPILSDGEAGILVDAAYGRVLFETNSDKKMYPASTTKIMTALLAIEAVERGEISMDTQIEITAEMIKDLPIDGSSIALKEGEIMSLDNLLKGLMVASGNDAACAIATAVGGSIPNFVNLMNQRADELSANDTQFANPHGLHTDEHYTTARDMAKIACAAMKLPKFRNICDIAHIKIPPTNKTEEERYYINTNGLLSAMRYTQYFYKGSIGIKTGYTDEAGNCLVSAATKGGIELIGVVFGAKDASVSHGDSAKMLDWGFANFTSVTALKKGDMACEIRVKQGRGKDTLTLAAEDSVKAIVKNGTNLTELELVPDIPDAIYAPVTAGQTIGKIKVMLNGEQVGEGVLLSTKDVKRSFFWPIMALGEWLWSFTLIRVIVYLVLAIIVAFIVLFIYAIYTNIKRAKKYRNARRSRR